MKLFSAHVLLTLLSLESDSTGPHLSSTTADVKNKQQMLKATGKERLSQSIKSDWDQNWDFTSSLLRLPP